MYAVSSVMSDDHHNGIQQSPDHVQGVGARRRFKVQPCSAATQLASVCRRVFGCVIDYWPQYAAE